MKFTSIYDLDEAFFVLEIMFKNKHIRQLFSVVALNLTERDSDRGTIKTQEGNLNHRTVDQLFSLFDAAHRGHAEYINAMITIKE